MQSAETTMQTCAHCSGRFPGPGIARSGKRYCCDKCAAGPRRKIPWMLGAVAMLALIFGGGVVFGRYLTRREQWLRLG